MSAPVRKMAAKTYQTLKTIYELSDRNAERVHAVLKKNSIKKETWLTFFELYAAKECGLDDPETHKTRFQEFCEEFTPYGRYIFGDEVSGELTVDWDAMMAQ
jgi:hypothetical protein